MILREVQVDELIYLYPRILEPLYPILKSSSGIFYKLFFSNEKNQSIVELTDEEVHHINNNMKKIRFHKNVVVSVNSFPICLFICDDTFFCNRSKNVNYFLGNYFDLLPNIFRLIDDQPIKSVSLSISSSFYIHGKTVQYCKEINESGSIEETEHENISFIVDVVDFLFSETRKVSRDGLAEVVNLAKRILHAVGELRVPIKDFIAITPAEPLNSNDSYVKLKALHFFNCSYDLNEFLRIVSNSQNQVHKSFFKYLATYVLHPIDTLEYYKQFMDIGNNYDKDFYNLMCQEIDYRREEWGLFAETKFERTIEKLVF